MCRSICTHPAPHIHFLWFQVGSSDDGEGGSSSSSDSSSDSSSSSDDDGRSGSSNEDSSGDEATYKKSKKDKKGKKDKKSRKVNITRRGKGKGKVLLSARGQVWMCSICDLLCSLSCSRARP
jgi:hypothetical protein